MFRGSTAFYEKNWVVTIRDGKGPDDIVGSEWGPHNEQTGENADMNIVVKNASLIWANRTEAIKPNYNAAYQEKGELKGTV